MGGMEVSVYLYSVEKLIVVWDGKQKSFVPISMLIFGSRRKISLRTHTQTNDGPLDFNVGPDIQQINL